jgi:mxaD protein
MKFILAVVSAVFAMASAQLFAAEAKELTAEQSIRIGAPPAAVWAVAGDFNGLPKWLPTIAESVIVLGTNNQIGAIRQLTRRNGTKVTERLIDYDPAAMRIGYTYVDGMVAASDYFPVMIVKDAGDGTTVVEWRARFKRLAYWMDPPPAGQEDQTLTDFFNKVYKSGLESLKQKIEGGQQ